MKILIFGLPGSGKSTLAEPFAKLIGGVWINADAVRKQYDDWDFSPEGRMRQAMRMKFLADGVVMAGKIAVADFVCPTNETREAFGDAFTIYVDRIDPEDSTYMNTRDLFVPPTKYNLRYDVTSTRHDALSVITNHQGSWT